MKLGLDLYGDIITSDNLRFAKQAGVTHIVAHIPGHFKEDEQKIITSGGPSAHWGISDPNDPVWTYAGMSDLKRAINAAGLELEALENFAPAHWYDVLLDGPRKQEQLEHLKRIIRDVGRVGIPIMGYNFSIAGVWGRSEGPFARGGAIAVGYENPAQPPIPKGMVWNMIYDLELYQSNAGTIGQVSAAEIWSRFSEFLNEMIPVAEEAGVRLALHPDDPPLPTLRGAARLVYHPDLYQRVIDVNPSPANALEFCIGTLSEAPDSDIYQAVERYSRAGRIAYIHFRNVQGKAPHYHEVFVDEGDTDMLRILSILRDNQFDGVLIPDHTPLFSCAAPWHAGMAYALGWMRAAMRALDCE